MCSKLLLVHGVWLSLYWSFSHTQFAQVLVPFLVKTRFEQQSIFFLPSYSSSVFFIPLNIVIYLNIVVPLNIVVSLNIVFDIIEYFPAICTNTTEGQAWKQASLCLPLDCLLWSTITMSVINNMFVKQSWNKYWLIDWLIITMIAMYTNDDDCHHHEYRIVHKWWFWWWSHRTLLPIYDAANFVTDARTNKVILGVG